MLVFVYGTLRQGESNHHWLAEGVFVGTHVTLPKYTLYHLGDYPAAVEGGATALVGEVFRVTPPVMAKLDVLEDFPNEYDRHHIPTPYGQAWIYLWKGEATGFELIQSGDWKRAVPRRCKPVQGA